MIRFNFLRGYYINPEDLKVGIVGRNPQRSMDAYIRHLIKKHLNKICLNLN